MYGHFFLAHGSMEGKQIAEQGHWMGRPGQATVEVVGPPDAISTVRVGGGAVVLIQGQLTL